MEYTVKFEMNEKTLRRFVRAKFQNVFSYVRYFSVWVYCVLFFCLSIFYLNEYLEYVLPFKRNMMVLFTVGFSLLLFYLVCPAKLKVLLYKKIYKTDNLEVSFTFSEKIEFEEFGRKYPSDYSEIVYFEDKIWFYLIAFKGKKSANAYFLPKDCFTSDTENFEKFIISKAENLLTKKQYFRQVLRENRTRILISIGAIFYCYFFLSDFLHNMVTKNTF